MKPVISLRKLWIMTAVGGILPVLGSVANQASVNFFSAMEGAIALDLGYLLVVYVVENYFTVRRGR